MPRYDTQQQKYSKLIYNVSYIPIIILLCTILNSCGFKNDLTLPKAELNNKKISSEVMNHTNKVSQDNNKS